MWLVVMFDLPVLTKAQRRAATKFRLWLLDEGWEMSQFSVYLRFVVGKEQADARTRAVGQRVPADGKVHILAVTDRQFEAMAVFRGDGRRRRGKRGPSQLELF
jgi:CRISPR-associated protein Cas2